MLNKGDVIVALMAKSGSGKTSVTLKLKEEYGTKLHVVKSKTTRAPREEDPNDVRSHVFCKMEDFNHHTAIAVYNSPKGYRSWADPQCFKTGKINVYAIDPHSCRHELVPYCEENDLHLIPIYIHVDESVRSNRYLAREGTLEGYSPEEHLSPDVMFDSDLFLIADGNGTMEDTARFIRNVINYSIRG